MRRFREWLMGLASPAPRSQKGHSVCIVSIGCRVIEFTCFNDNRGPCTHKRGCCDIITCAECIEFNDMRSLADWYVPTRVKSESHDYLRVDTCEWVGRLADSPGSPWRIVEPIRKNTVRVCIGAMESIGMTINPHAYVCKNCGHVKDEIQEAFYEIESQWDIMEALEVETAKAKEVYRKYKERR